MRVKEVKKFSTNNYKLKYIYIYVPVGVKATKETLMNFIERGKQIGAGSQLEDAIYCYELWNLDAAKCI